MQVLVAAAVAQSQAEQQVTVVSQVWRVVQETTALITVQAVAETIRKVSQVAAVLQVLSMSGSKSK
jgi:hypothetical protein